MYWTLPGQLRFQVKEIYLFRSHRPLAPTTSAPLLDRAYEPPPQLDNGRGLETDRFPPIEAMNAHIGPPRSCQCSGQRIFGRVLRRTNSPSSALTMAKSIHAVEQLPVLLRSWTESLLTRCSMLSYYTTGQTSYTCGEQSG